MCIDYTRRKKTETVGGERRCLTLSGSIIYRMCVCVCKVQCAREYGSFRRMPFTLLRFSLNSRA